MKSILFVGLALAGLVGCASQQERLDKGQTTAVETAIARARFEMGCPEAKGQVLSRTLIEPPVSGGSYGPYGHGLTGVELAEYTVGVDGCERRMTQVVVCAVDGTGCFSAKGPL